jgi:hypothetical protein
MILLIPIHVKILTRGSIGQHGLFGQKRGPIFLTVLGKVPRVIRECNGR